MAELSRSQPLFVNPTTRVSSWLKIALHSTRAVWETLVVSVRPFSAFQDNASRNRRICSERSERKMRPSLRTC